MRELRLSEVMPTSVLLSRSDLIVRLESVCLPDLLMACSAKVSLLHSLGLLWHLGHDRCGSLGKLVQGFQSKIQHGLVVEAYIGRWWQ